MLSYYTMYLQRGSIGIAKFKKAVEEYLQSTEESRHHYTPNVHFPTVENEVSVAIGLHLYIQRTIGGFVSCS